MEPNETIFPQKYAENRPRFRTAYVTLLYDVCLDVICESAGRPTHPMEAAARQRMSGGESHGNEAERFGEAASDAGVVFECVHVGRVAIVAEFPADHVLWMIGDELAAGGITDTGESDPCAGVAGDRGVVGGFAHTDRLSTRNSAG